MFVVADSDELFSLLIRGKKKPGIILFSDCVGLTAHEFQLIEFANNEQDALSKTRCPKVVKFNCLIWSEDKSLKQQSLIEVLKMLNTGEPAADMRTTH